MRNTCFHDHVLILVREKCYTMKLNIEHFVHKNPRHDHWIDALLTYSCLIISKLMFVSRCFWLQHTVSFLFIRKDESSTINKNNIKWSISWEQQVLYENLFMTIWQILFLTAKRSYFIGKDEYKMNKYNTKWGISEMKNNWKLFLNNEIL